MMTGEKEIERLVPSQHKSTPYYPGLIRKKPNAPERLFSVGRKGEGFDDVRSETVEVNGGCLIFRNGSTLVIAFAPGSWTTLEECEDE